MDEDWMAVTEAEIEEMLYRGGMSAGEEWFGASEVVAAASLSPSPSPRPMMAGGHGNGNGNGNHVDQGFGGLETAWVQQPRQLQQQQQQYQGLDHHQQQVGFDASLVDPRMRGEYGSGEYYAQGQQQLEVPGYGYSNTLGVYQSGVQIQVTQPGMYDGSSGLVSQGQMGSWQGGYTAAGW